MRPWYNMRGAVFGSTLLVHFSSASFVGGAGSDGATAATGAAAVERGRAGAVAAAGPGAPGTRCPAWGSVAGAVEAGAGIT